MHNFLQMINARFPIRNPDYYSKENLVQVLCKMQNAMHDDKQIFFDFLNKMRDKKQKNDSITPRLCKHTQTALKQSSMVKEI